MRLIVLFTLVVYGWWISVCCAVCAKWPQTIWQPLLPKAHYNWHPPLVPFPVVLVLLEFGALVLFQAQRRRALDQAAKYFLYLAGLSLVPTILAGLHDVGIDYSSLNPIAAGLSDRARHFFDFSDPLSVHFLYACTVAVLMMLRLIWRRWFYSADSAVQRFSFLVSSGALSWLVFATAQVGGSMVYP